MICSHDDNLYALLFFLVLDLEIVQQGFELKVIICLSARKTERISTKLTVFADIGKFLCFFQVIMSPPLGGFRGTYGIIATVSLVG